MSAFDLLKVKVFIFPPLILTSSAVVEGGGGGEGEEDEAEEGEEGEDRGRRG